MKVSDRTKTLGSAFSYIFTDDLITMTIGSIYEPENNTDKAKAQYQKLNDWRNKRKR